MIWCGSNALFYQPGMHTKINDNESQVYCSHEPTKFLHEVMQVQACTPFRNGEGTIGT